MMVQIAIRLPKELHEALKDAAEDDDRTVTSYVRRLIKADLPKATRTRPEAVSIGRSINAEIASTGT